MQKALQLLQQPWGGAGVVVELSASALRCTSTNFTSFTRWARGLGGVCVAVELSSGQGSEGVRGEGAGGVSRSEGGGKGLVGGGEVGEGSKEGASGGEGGRGAHVQS